MGKQTRINEAVKNAEQAFWAEIAINFPEVPNGDIGMRMALRLEELHKEAVKHWLDINTVHTVKAESWAIKLNLKDKTMWQLVKTADNCTLVLSNILVYGTKSRYIGISSRCVAIYDYVDATDLAHELSSWYFGNNPSILMDQMQDFLFNDYLLDLNVVFDDIITIAKSGLVA